MSSILWLLAVVVVAEIFLAQIAAPVAAEQAVIDLLLLENLLAADRLLSQELPYCRIHTR
jgi:hypothetical protein